MRTPTFIVHLLSGGIDSTVMLHDLVGQGFTVHAVLFDYKQRHVQELIWAKYHCRLLNVNYTTIEIPQLRGSELTDGSGGVVVPCRNAVLLTHAVNLAVSLGADKVTFAANKDDEAQFPDCRMAFVQTFNLMLTTSCIPVEVEAPYHDRPKWWICGKAKEMGVPLNQTWSCYRGGDEPCGKCLACQKRNEAMAHQK